MRFETRGHGANPVYAATKEWWIFQMNLADISAADLITEWIPGLLEQSLTS